MLACSGSWWQMRKWQRSRCDGVVLTRCWMHSVDGGGFTLIFCPQVSKIMLELLSHCSSFITSLWILWTKRFCLLFSLWGGIRRRRQIQGTYLVSEGVPPIWRWTRWECVTLAFTSPRFVPFSSNWANAACTQQRWRLVHTNTDQHCKQESISCSVHARGGNLTPDDLKPGFIYKVKVTVWRGWAVCSERRG